MLDDLVAKGTITAAQKQAIVDGLQAEREQRTAMKARMEALRAQAEKVKGFMSDGQITQEELDKLPADSPLRKLTNLMDDGKITTDELRSIGRASAASAASAAASAASAASADKCDNKASPSPSPTTGG